MNGELDRIGKSLGTWESEDRQQRRAGAHGTHELGPRAAGNLCLDGVGVARKRLDEDPEGCIGTRLAHDEMRGQIACRPATAQGRSVRARLKEEVAEFLALLPGDVGGLHVAIVAQLR